jgi:hypothetical protein
MLAKVSGRVAIGSIKVTTDYPWVLAASLAIGCIAPEFVDVPTINSLDGWGWLEERIDRRHPVIR